MINYYYYYYYRHQQHHHFIDLVCKFSYMPVYCVKQCRLKYRGSLCENECSERILGTPASHSVV